MIDLPGRALLRGSAQGRISTAPLAEWAALGLLCSPKQKAVQSIVRSILDDSFNSK